MGLFGCCCVLRPVFRDEAIPLNRRQDLRAKERDTLSGSRKQSRPFVSKVKGRNGRSIERHSGEYFLAGLDQSRLWINVFVGSINGDLSATTKIDGKIVGDFNHIQEEHGYSCLWRRRKQQGNINGNINI